MYIGESLGLAEAPGKQQFEALSPQVVLCRPNLCTGVGDTSSPSRMGPGIR